MGKCEKGSLETVRDAFQTIEALIKDAHCNAAMKGPDRMGLHIGADYLRLAAQQVAALADLIDAIASQNSNRCNNAKQRLSETDRNFQKYLDAVAVDNRPLWNEHCAMSFRSELDAFEALLKDRVGKDAFSNVKPSQDDEKATQFTGPYPRGRSTLFH